MSSDKMEGKSWNGSFGDAVLAPRYHQFQVDNIDLIHSLSEELTPTIGAIALSFLTDILGKKLPSESVA